MKRFLCFFIFLMLMLTCYAQGFLGEYVTRVWTTADGLPGNTITDIIQDKTGYIYIGTYGGLVRFDGVEFVVLNKSSNENYNFVSARKIFADSKGNLWVGSNDEGIIEISGHNIITYNTSCGLPNNSIRGIAEDKNGNIWVGTASGVAYITPQGIIERPDGLKEYGEDNILVVELYCDTAGVIWISGPKNNSVYSFAKDKFVKFTGFNKYSDSPITAISQDSSGAFWFGLNNGNVIHYDSGTIIKYDKSNCPIDSTINAIYQDSSSIIWFATEHGCVYLKDGKFYSYKEDSGIANTTITRILEDREGNIWLGTDRAGLEKMSPGKFMTINLESSVNCIAEDKSGLVWIGTDDGVLCYDKFVRIENEVTKKLSGVRIRHLGLTKSGGLLISSYAKYGQVLYENGKFTSWTQKDGLTGDKVRVAIEDSNGNLYVGTTTGLAFINLKDGSVRTYTRKDGLNNDYIMCLFEDDDGTIWIGTDGGGINLLQHGAITKLYSTDSGLVGNVIFKISKDERGYVWICTGTGISRFDGYKFDNFNSAQGLGTDSVFQVLTDYTGTVWMTSNRGISSIGKNDFDKYLNKESDTLDPKFYTKNDGLRSDGITSTSLSMTDSMGRVWFTLIDGFSIYDPVKIHSNYTTALLEIEYVKLDDEKYTPPFETIVVNPGVKRIDIKYAGLSYVSPQQVRFRYKLEGFDEEFSDAVSTRLVSYTNLRPGKYKFEVMCSNSDGVWSDKISSVDIIQKPFYYQTFYFWITFILIVFIFIWAFIRLRLRHMESEQLRLEAMVQMKTADLEFEKNRSERLLLNILPKQIAERLKTHEESVIADKVDNVTVLFTDLVGFTRITSNCDPDVLIDMLNNLFTRFDNRAKALNIEKIKTIGDAYMAVSGLIVKDENHALNMVKFAQGILKDLEDFNRTSDIKFQMRIGINSGSVVAGVIGTSKFIYDLWGDTVNVASRMETTGSANTIHISESTKNLIFKDIKFYDEEEIQVKGKGTMKACYVDTKNFVDDVDYDADLLNEMEQL